MLAARQPIVSPIWASGRTGQETLAIPGTLHNCREPNLGANPRTSVTNRESVTMLKKFWSAVVLAAIFLPAAQAATIWNGPQITYTKSGSSSDTILAGKVVLKRGSSGPLYNTALGETSARTGSPKGITFAFGDLSNAESLTYKTLDSMRRNPHLSDAILNKAMVAHIADGDIYFSIKFTSWGMHGAGSVKYTRSTAAAAVVPPTVTLTSPTEGANFTSPATVNLSANATAGSSAITEVSFFNGANLLGTATSAPYNFTANNLSSGAYSFTAVAKSTDSAATSGVVHITVTAPVPTVALTSPSEGATFTAPATINLSANAAGAPITSVSFFNGATLLGSVPNAPYTLTLTNVAAGSYSFTAVANTAETSATSAAVNVTVNASQAAGDVTLHPVALSNGQFSFGYPTDPGFSYIIQEASTFGASGFDWSSVSTNKPSGNTAGTATFSEPVSTDHFRFFRVGRVTQ